MSNSNCHQWCECPKCTTFYDMQMNEIPNPHTGTYSYSAESIILRLEKRIRQLEDKIRELEGN